MKKLLLFIVLLMSAAAGKAETWVPIGLGMWEDPYFIHTTLRYPYRRGIDMEKSEQTPGKYRIALLGQKVIVHAENPSAVYIEPYTGTSSADNDTFTFTQNCKENGLSGSQYGTLEDGKIVIPGNYFLITNKAGYTKVCPESGNCIITLPGSGVYMSILAFNDKLPSQPFMLLNEGSKENFTSFVDGLEMGNATLLYYAVDLSISTMETIRFSKDLSNAVLITFTDGLDQGSLAYMPGYRTSRNYATHLAERIAQTSIQGCQLEAYAIGLKSKDVYDDELFMYNLASLASDEKNISTISNINEMQQKFTDLLENLNKQTTQRVVSINVPMKSHGDKYRFTLDHSSENATASNVWFEGVFNIDNMSLENITYHGFTSTSGTSIRAQRDGIRLLFTLNDCRDLSGDILDVDKNGIDEWQYLPSRDIWIHNVENAKEEDIDIQNIHSSVAIMLALDCSTSLGELFPLVKSTANSFINRLAGADDSSAIEDITVSEETTIDINDPSVEFYNLQGVRVAHPAHGIYICRKGNIVKKIAIR